MNLPVFTLLYHLWALNRNSHTKRSNCAKKSFESFLSLVYCPKIVSPNIFVVKERVFRVLYSSLASAASVSICAFFAI